MESDEQLIQLFDKGNIKAFDSLYARYKQAIYHYFLRQVHSKSIADELHQDVWLNIIKSPSRFNHNASFKTWLYKVAHNRLIDHYRHNSKQALSLVQSTSSDQNSEKEAIVATDRPDESLHEHQLKQALLQAVASLPEEQKEVFLLHEKSGLTLREIAQVTDSSFESTKSRLRYAVKKLHNHMTQHMGVEQ